MEPALKSINGFIVSFTSTTPDKTVETIPSIFLLLRPTPVSPKHKK